MVSIVIIAAASGAAAVVAGPSLAADGRGAFYVQFEPGRKAEVAAAVARAGGRVTHDLESFGAVAVLLPEAALTGLRRAPGVRLVEPVPEHRLSAQVVPYNIDQVQARELWDANGDGEVDFGAPDGGGVTFCIIDTGFYAAHDDLAALSASGTSQISGEAWTEDGHGHGTHVAGTASAVANSIGVVGVTPGGLSLRIVKVFNNSGRWVPGQSNLGAAAQWCRDQGADVISMSLGGGYSATEDTIFQGLYDTDGILNVAAAGNDGAAVAGYPASYDSVVSVGALTEDDVHAVFSQFPPSANDANAPPANVEWDVVELSAGGVQVLSTVPSPDGAVPIYRVVVDGSEYRARPIAESGLGTVAGDLVAGGLCDSVGAWSALVVLCERGAISFADKINNVRSGGGVAALVYNNVAGNFLGTCGGGCTLPLIPALSLSQGDGQFLVANRLGQTAEVTADDGSGCGGCTGGYESWDGTSMATPAVAAAMAAVWDACGGASGASNKQLRQLFRDAALDLQGTSSAGSYGAGYDPFTGFGLVQVGDAFGLGRSRFGATCALAFAVDPPMRSVCTSSVTTVDYAVELGDAYSGTTDLSVFGAPAGATPAFVPPAVVWPATASTLTLSGLDGVADGEHAFTVHAEDSAVAADAADVGAVVGIYSAPAGAPAPTSPASGEAGQPLTLTLSWSPVEAALTYEVEVATSPAFAAVVDSASGLTAPEYEVSGLSADTTYYWRVRSQNPCGDGAWSAAFSFSTAPVYCSSAAASIPDNDPGGAESAIVVGALGTISDLDISLEIDHTWIGDLRVELSHGAVGPVTLIDRMGTAPSYCSADDLDLVLDDEATAGAIDDACPPSVGERYTPESALTAFDGTETSGTWTLKVVDVFSSDTGQLIEWCLLPTVASSCRPDGIFCDGFESGDTSGWDDAQP